jgi:hypothetical protein
MATVKKEFDKFWVGIITGLLVPQLIMFLFYLQVYYRKMNVQSFIKRIWETDIFSPLISLCCIGNLAAFFIFYYLYCNNSARGVIISTFVYTIIVVFLKFVF